MPKVTERLRKTWAEQRAQMLDEREFTQSGLPRSESDIVIVDDDIAVLDVLLSLPVGARLDVNSIYADVAKPLTEADLTRPSH